MIQFGMTPLKVFTYKIFPPIHSSLFHKMTAKLSNFFTSQSTADSFYIACIGSYHEQIKIGKGRTVISPNEAYMFSCNAFPVPIKLSQLISNLMTNELPFR